MRKAIMLVIALCFIIGCDKGNYVDVGPIIVDKNLLWENIDVK